MDTTRRYLLRRYNGAMWKSGAKSESIVFNGIVFRRYPEAKQDAYRRYYRPHGGHVKRGIQHIHQEIWKSHYGPIPDGCHIHHKDGDFLNNDISNLECVSSEKHHKVHGERGDYATTKALQHLAKIRHLTVAWHQSAEGKEWHRRHAKQHGFGKAIRRCAICSECGKDYCHEYVGKSKFCSGKCSLRSRRKSKIDNENRICATCGKVFSVSRYAKQKNCSRACGRIASNLARAACRLQSN